MVVKVESTAFLPWPNNTPPIIIDSKKRYSFIMLNDLTDERLT